MELGVDVDGLPTVVARLDHASDGLHHLEEANADIAKVVTGSESIPRATGAMAGSETITVTGSGWGLTYGKPYAAYVHWGSRVMAARPWAWEAATRSEDRWMGGFTDHVQDMLNGD